MIKQVIYRSVSRGQFQPSLCSASRPAVSVLCGHARRPDASVLKKKNNNWLLKLNPGSLCC